MKLWQLLKSMTCSADTKGDPALYGLLRNVLIQITSTKKFYSVENVQDSYKAKTVN